MLPSEDDVLTTASAPHSRRDFLRRASRQAVKEAVEIGTKVVPGGVIVRQFVERSNPDVVEREAGDVPRAASAEFLRNPLKWFAAWRDEKSGKSER